jgi:hypothetical protein
MVEPFLGSQFRKETADKNERAFSSGLLQAVALRTGRAAERLLTRQLKVLQRMRLRPFPLILRSLTLLLPPFGRHL